MKNSKFNQLYESIIKESIFGSRDDDGSSCGTFLWKNNMTLRKLRDPKLSKEIGEQVFNALVDELSENVGKKYDIEFPGHRGVENVKILKVDDDKKWLYYEGKNQWVPTKTEEKQILIGYVMTQKSYDLLESLMKPTLDKLKERDKINAENERKENERLRKEKKTTYENEDVKKFIDSLPKSLIGDYAWKTIYKLPQDFKDKFSKQPEHVKEGFINYIDDMKFSDPNIEYMDRGYRTAVNEYNEANRRLKDMVQELKNL